MLDLDSPRWKELSHPYESVEDVPHLLRELAATAPSQLLGSPALDSLSYLLCDHGYGPVCTASYAAVPHFIALATTRLHEERSALIHLAASIEIHRNYGDAPSIPDDLVEDYVASLGQMRILALECLKERQTDEESFHILAGVLAVANGYVKYGNAIMHLKREGEVCHECGARVPIFGYWPESMLADEQD